MKIQSKLNEYLRNDKIKYVCTFLILGILSWVLQKKEVQASAVVNEMKPIDHLLGDGQIAAPIELSNSEAIDGLMDQNAFVNLYSLHPQTLKANTKVATRVRLARSPKDQLRFFVILNESELQKLMQKEGPFYAVLQNRHRTGPTHINDSNKIVKINSFITVGEL